MKIKILALKLISVTLALNCPAVLSAQQSKVIRIVLSDCEPARTGSDGDSKSVSVTLDDRNVLVDASPYPFMSYLFTAEGLFTMNHKFKTYSVQGYDELEAMVIHKTSEIAKSQERANIRRDVQLKLTEETDTINGFKVRKIVKLGKPELEMWVSSELIPLRLRTFGERLKAILPADYWEKELRNPGMPEIIMLYGVPLKVVLDRNTVCRANIHESTKSDSPFEIPVAYKRVEAK